MLYNNSSCFSFFGKGTLPLLQVDAINPRDRLIARRLDYDLAGWPPFEDEAAVFFYLYPHIDLLFLRFYGLYCHRLSDTNVGLHLVAVIVLRELLTKLLYYIQHSTTFI